MELTLAILLCACHLAAALALALERWHRPVLALLLLTAVACGAYGAFGPSNELLCTHTYAGYQGVDLETSAVHYPTATMPASRLWPLPFAAFALFAAAALWLRRAPAPRNALVLPLLFAWAATAAWLGMQFFAAPAPLVQPFGLDRLLWPAGLLLTLSLARSGMPFGRVFLFLSLGLVVQRLPAALFSKLASDGGWGTGLDIAKVTDIVHPLTKLQFEPKLTAGSAEQQFWLIWAEHVFAFPAFYLLSFTGIAFACSMIARHDRMAD